MTVLLIDAAGAIDYKHNRLTNVFFKSLVEDGRMDFEIVTAGPGPLKTGEVVDIPPDKYDAVVLPSSESAKSSKRLKCPVLARMPDPKPGRCTRLEWLVRCRALGVDAFWSWVPELSMRRQLPCLGDFGFYQIVPGVERNLGLTEAATHGKRGRPLIMGARAPAPVYHGRTLCEGHPATISVGEQYFGDDYAGQLLSHHAGVAACDWIVQKYFELPACGMLTFMWRSPANRLDELGFVDGETCVVLDDDNYKGRLDEYSATPNDPKWDEIAARGQGFVLDRYGIEAQKTKLINILKDMIG